MKQSQLAILISMFFVGVGFLIIDITIKLLCLSVSVVWFIVYIIHLIIENKYGK